MNIYHIISNNVWGGGEQYVFDLTSQLIKDGEYVEIISRDKPDITSRFRWLEVPISTLPLNGLSDWDSAVRMARVIKKRKNVIIHVHNFKSAFTACIARKISENPDVKIVLTRHLVKRGKRGILYNRLYKDIDKIIFVSKLAKDKFLSTNPRIDHTKLEVIHNSILPGQNVDNYKFDLRQRFNIPTDKVLLMFHGRIVPEKGVDTLLKAVSQLDRRRFHLIIAGAGTPQYINELHNIVTSNSLDKNVTFIGYVDTIHPLIAQSDIGVLPTTAQEAFGLANLEYMMHAKPQVCSNNGAQVEYLEDTVNGLLVPPSNPFSLAEAIQKLLDSPELRIQMGKNAEETFNSKMSYPHFYNKIQNIYKSLFT